MLLVWTFYLSKYHEKCVLLHIYIILIIIIYHINIVAQLSTVFNIDINKKWFIWSCDTEDWSNYAENAALNNMNNLYLKYIKIENSYFKL